MEKKDDDDFQPSELRLPKLKKAVEALAAIPIDKPISRLTRQSWNVFLWLATRHPATPPDKIEFKGEYFTAPLPDVLSRLGGDKGSTAMKRIFKEMMRTKVTWQAPSVGESTNVWTMTTLLSEVRIREHGGVTWVDWAYPPSIRKELLDPKPYAQIRLETVVSFVHGASVALYEICCRYTNNPREITSRRPWTWWCQVLASLPEGTSPPEYRYFRRDTLNPALEEINQKSELIVELIEHKVPGTRRTVGDLQFRVRRKDVEGEVRSLPPMLTVDAPDDIATLAQQLGVTAADAATAFAEQGYTVVMNALQQLQARAADASQEPVRTPSGYFRTLVQKLSGGSSATLPTSASTTAETTGASAADESTTSQAAAAEKQYQTKVAWVRTQLAGLSIPDRNQLLDEYSRTEEAANLSPTLRRRLEERSWDHQTLRAYLMNYFWLKVNGTKLGDYDPTFDDNSFTVPTGEQSTLF